MFIIRVYGASCNYFVGHTTGVMSQANACHFQTEDEARAVALRLYTSGQIGYWEVRQVA